MDKANGSTELVRVVEFHDRGQEISRLEGLGDVVFGVALAALALPGTDVNNFEGLDSAIRQLPAFAAGFAILIGIWWRHYMFFRRYGLKDHRTIALNAILLFIVLSFMFPLKFSLFYVIPLIPQMMESHCPLPDPTKMARAILTTFSGVTMLFVSQVLLFHHAYRKRGDLGLNQVEVFETRATIVALVLLLAWSILASVATLCLPKPWALANGIGFGLALVPILLLNRRWKCRRR